MRRHIFFEAEGFESAGKIALGETCDVTDPCYDKDVWCRTTLKDMEPGSYDCYYKHLDDAFWGNRIAAIRIIKEDKDDCLFWDNAGEIGVDAGLAGFFNNKPDFNDNDWSALCDSLNFSEKIVEVRSFNGDEPDAFFTESGYGDGSYELSVAKNRDGKIYAAQVVFIDDEEDDDEYDEYDEYEDEDEHDD